jgi:hypothetical protein
MNIESFKFIQPCCSIKDILISLGLYECGLNISYLYSFNTKLWDQLYFNFSAQSIKHFTPVI